MKILVIGDFISDVYTFGRAERLCPEAPVPVLIPESWKQSWGGAGLVFEQLSALAEEVRSRFLSYSRKERYFAGSHLVCRVDDDNCGPIRAHANLIIPVEVEDLKYFDAFVISDYGKGGMTRELARQIVETGKPCFVDAKHNWLWYEGMQVVAFPNEIEFPFRFSVRYYAFKTIVKKLGARGCKMGNLELPATVSEVVDVTGAGDIFMAAFVYAWSIQFTPEDCLRFANELAGESCRHRGTFVVGREFALSVLDRLRASRASEQKVRGSSLGSTPAEHAPSSRPDQYVYPKSRGIDGNLHADLPLEVGGQEAHIQYDSAAPTLPQSPLVPTESLAAQPLQVRAKNASGRKAQSSQQSPSSIASERQCERTPGQDQGKIRSQP
jgi:bifunctional ADP-heptose synthase (sugar kinase/adenylyltransferase)